MELSTSLSSSFFSRFCPDPTVMYDLGELYAEFSERFFYGFLPELPYKQIADAFGESRKQYGTLKWDGRLKGRTLGTYAFSKNPGHGVIRLSRRIASDPVRTRSVLLHKMLHKHLDYIGKSDGILGHGPNFTAAAKRINDKCREMGVEYRVMFYDLEVTKEAPQVKAELLEQHLFYDPDLDISLRMTAVARAAFGEKFEYHQ